MWVHAIPRKAVIFCERCKKIKHVSQKALFLASYFIFFFTQLKQQIDF
jgi:hypothetical protein